MILGTFAWLEGWLLGPPGPTINHLAMLSYASEDKGQERLHELVEWRVQRATTVAKATVGAAASFSTALVLSLFKNELHIASAVLAVALVLSLLSASFGIYTMRRLASLSSDYSVLLVLLRLLR